MLSIDLYKKFSRTKLVFGDQWSSHPSTEERVNRLMALNEPAKEGMNGVAVDLLSNKTLVLEQISQRLFENVTFSQEPEILDISTFRDDYLKVVAERAYPLVFKGYFDTRDPYKKFTVNDFEKQVSEDFLSLDQLINDQTLADLNTYSIATQDKENLERIQNGTLEVDSFDYDGVKYLAADVYPLIAFLGKEIERFESFFAIRDEQIFSYFVWVAKDQGCMESFIECALAYQASAAQLDRQREAYSNLVNTSSFMHSSVAIASIPGLIEKVKEAELPFKAEIKLLVEDANYNSLIDEEMRSRFNGFLSSDWKYFVIDTYFQNEVDGLFGAMIDFSSIVFQRPWRQKKEILEFEAGMLDYTK